MKLKAFAISLSFVVVALLSMCSFSSAQQETILLDLTLNFGVGGDPQANLLRDAKGNLYGTTSFGGLKGGGTVFELQRGPNGTWTRKVLYPFKVGIYDGQRPQGGVIFDAAGNLYGTTFWGGLYNQGEVFELIPQATGYWKEKVLHSFGGTTQDGQNPNAGVIFDSLGNLYGTAMNGGGHGVGIVYELMPQSNGTWKEKILHTFNIDGTDGYVPLAGVVMDGRGNLYGDTNGGGTLVGGTVFELSPTAQGPWRETILHNFSFNGADGSYPYGVPVFDRSGNLYGVTNAGGLEGSYGAGIVFELSPAGKGSWTEAILHNFNDSTGDGVAPSAGMIFDHRGNLYGVTQAGGTYNLGTVFELSPATGGGWSEAVLYNFGSVSDDGIAPLASLIFDPAGNLYGTTDEGGTTGYGTVYEITP